MNPTTDFELWLNALELDDHGEVYSLYRAVKDVVEFGIYEAVPAAGPEGRWLVNAMHVTQPLLLTSKSREYFLKQLVDDYCGDLDMESWHSLMQEVNKGVDPVN